MNNITKEQFDTAYNNHPPSAWIKFAYKYFSKGTEKKNKGLSRAITFIILASFTVGFVSVLSEFPESVIKYSTYVYCIVLPALVIFLLSATIANSKRVKKIIKELGVSDYEYNVLVTMYG